MKITPPYKACIFDLDGTLLNTLPTIVHYGNHTLKTFGFQEIEADYYGSICGLSFKEYYESLLRYGGCPEKDVEELADRVGHHDLEMYTKDPFYLTEPFAGVPEILTALKQRDVRLAVLTNKPDQAAQDLVSAFFPDTFDACIGYTGLQPAKPDPHSLWDLIDRLYLEKQHCIFTGDTEIDVNTANNAGIYSVGVTWGYQSAEGLIKYSPGALISAPGELLPYFE